jgi:hypothetical protein
VRHGALCQRICPPGESDLSNTRCSKTSQPPAPPAAPCRR